MNTTTSQVTVMTVTICITLVAVLCVVGTIALACMGRAVPTSLETMAAMCGGGLCALLASTRTQFKERED